MSRNQNIPALEIGRRYVVRLQGDLRVRSQLPAMFAARFVKRKRRHDNLSGDFVGWLSIFADVGSWKGDGCRVSLPDQGFTAEPLSEDALIS